MPLDHWNLTPPAWPYTPEEERRIIAALKPADVSQSATLLEKVSRLSGSYDYFSKRPTNQACRDMMKKLLDDIGETSAKLFELLQGAQDAVLAGLPFATVHDMKERLFVLEDDVEVARLQWSKGGRPSRKTLHNYVDMLLEIWLAEHPDGMRPWSNKTLPTYDSARGQSSEDRLFGPFPEFVAACIEPVMSPGDQKSVRRYLKDHVLPAVRKAE